MDNPFSIIVPRENELMINESFLKELSNKIKENIKQKKLIILEGDYGSGKSLYLKRLYARLKTKKEKIHFTDAINNILKNKVAVKNKSLFIRNFDLIQGLNEEQLFDLTESIMRLIKEGMIILTACRKDTLKKIYEVNPLLRSKTLKIKIPKLNFEEIKELIINRLNENRKEKNDSLEPFTETELRKIHSKAKGNPRLILLLLKPLYEQRMMLKE